MKHKQPEEHLKMCSFWVRLWHVVPGSSGRTLGAVTGIQSSHNVTQMIILTLVIHTQILGLGSSLTEMARGGCVLKEKEYMAGLGQGK